MDENSLRIIANLIRDHRWAALATQGESDPEASWVAYAPNADFSSFILHISRLAPHTPNLLRNPRACLAISEQEKPGQDPQLLARIMIQGEVNVIPRETPDYSQSAQLYRERLPDSAQLFSFADFVLVRLRPVRARFIGGFANAHNLDPANLSKAATVLQSPVD